MAKSNPRQERLRQVATSLKQMNEASKQYGSVESDMSFVKEALTDIMLQMNNKILQTDSKPTTVDYGKAILDEMIRSNKIAEKVAEEEREERDRLQRKEVEDGIEKKQQPELIPLSNNPSSPTGSSDSSGSGGFFGAMIGMVGMLGGTILKGIGGMLLGGLSAGGGLLGGLGKLLGGLAEFSLDGLLGGGKILGKILAPGFGITKLLGKFLMPINAIFAAIEGVSDFFDTDTIAKKLGIGKGDVTIFDRIMAGLGGFVSRFFGNLIDPFLKLFGIDFSVEKFIDGGFDYIHKSINSAAKNINTKGFSKWAGDLATDMMDTAGKILKSVWDTVTHALVTLKDGLIDWLANQSWVPSSVKSKILDWKAETDNPEYAKAKKQYQQDVADHNKGVDGLEQAQRSEAILKTQMEGYDSTQHMIFNTGFNPYKEKYDAAVKERQRMEQLAGIKPTVPNEDDFKGGKKPVAKTYPDTSNATSKYFDPSQSGIFSGKSAVPFYQLGQGAGATDKVTQEVGKIEGVSPIYKQSTDDSVESNLLNMIGQKESGGDYNVIYGGTSIPLTDMTLAEVLNYQKTQMKNGSTAVGKYQFINSTLQEAARNSGIGPDDKLTPENQDKMAMYLLRRRGLDDFKSGKISDQQFASNLALEWASLPMMSGKSAYDGVQGNRSLMSYNDLMGTIHGSGPTWGAGTSLINNQRQTANAQTEIASAPITVQNITQNATAAPLTITLRNDEPSFKKIIEQLAYNAMGVTGSPIFNH